MFQLNLDAVRCRYPNEPDEHLPGPTGPKGYTYRNGGIPKSVTEAIRCYETWAYQCAEGDIWERPLFRELREVYIEMLRTALRISDKQYDA